MVGQVQVVGSTVVGRQSKYKRVKCQVTRLWFTLELL